MRILMSKLHSGIVKEINEFSKTCFILCNEYYENFLPGVT